MKIKRGLEPELLQSDQMKLAIEKLREFYMSEKRDQKRYDFPFNREIDEKLKNHLHAVFNRKCGYCEVKIDLPVDGAVDRFRPHSGVREKKEYHEDLYWWLTFTWSNLIYCCKECLQYKANYFPIAGKRAMTEKDNLEEEFPLLIDPCSEDLDFHITYDDQGAIHALTDMGSQTIRLLRLDRASHKEKRKKAWEEILVITEGLHNADQKDIPVQVNYLKSIFSDPTLEFISFKRWVLLEELNRWPLLYRLLGLDQELFDSIRKKRLEVKSTYSIVSENNVITNDFFPIEYIRIKNFKGVSNITIHFREDDIRQKSWLFLLGENGAGKSSILQAIAVGIMADKKILMPLIPSLIQKGKAKAEIVIKERDNNNSIITILKRKDKSISQEGTYKSFLLGYGSLRLSADKVKVSARQDKIKISYENLFSPIKPLNDITKWLKYIHKNNLKFFNVIAYSIKQLLPHDFPQNELTVVKGEIMFKGSKKSFSELSDGFKSTIILAVDIMMKLSSAQTDMDKMTGIVLIDELGNQLHPRWQMRIVKQLRTVFPNLNFIISTHHPLCLRGSEKSEILLLKHINNQLVPVTELPDPAPLRVDQLLASEFFGLSSLIDPELEAKFNRYYELLAKEKNITAKEQEELSSMKDELRNQKQLGSSLREELMYTVIDNLLASKLVYDKQSLNRDELKAEVIKRVGEIWNKLNIQQK